MGLFGLVKNVLYVPQGVYEEMVNHSKESYPHECCGVLVGSALKDKRVFESHRMENTNTERAHDRFIIDPKELNFIDKTSRAQGLEILGFYHSHPDHPDKPSATDREWGHPGYSYVIISVHKGKDCSARCWAIEEDDGPFKEEKLKIG